MKRRTALDPLRVGIRSKDVLDLYDRMVAQGWRVRLTGAQHLYCVSPDNIEHITMSRTANGLGRRAKNYAAQVKRWEKRNGIERN